MIRSIGTSLGVVGALSLAGCVNPSVAPAAGNAESMSAPSSGLEHFEHGNRTSSAWVSDSFDGSKSRQFIGETLYFEVEQHAAEGGLDVGVSEVDFDLAPVSTAKINLHVCSSYAAELDGPGRWWAGPKISVNWQGEESAKHNGDDWYENYIVEIASSSPEDLHDLFTGDYFQAEELPPLILAGSTYRNYKIRFHDWWQFWSVRQDYRATGVLAIEPIVDTWIASGLPTDRQFDGVKANIETYGPITGTGRLSMSASSDPMVLDCASVQAD